MVMCSKIVLITESVRKLSIYRYHMSDLDCERNIDPVSKKVHYDLSLLNL